MAACTRSASCRCPDCMAAMGMFSANDLKQIASSNIDFGEDEGSTETKNDSGVDQPLQPRVSKPPVKPDTGENASSPTKPKPQPKQQLESKSAEIKPNPVNVVETPNISPPTSTKAPGPTGEEEAPVEENFEGQPVGDLLKSSNWKARKFAYESLEKEHFLERSTAEAFASDLVGIAGEKSMGAMDAALGCLIAYAKKCMDPPAAESCIEMQQEIVALVVKKPLVGRTSTKKLAVELLMLMAELGKEGTSLVCEGLQKGLGEKSPKVQQAVLEALESCVNAFGPSVLPVMVVKSAVLRGLALKPPLVRKQALGLAVTMDLHMQGAFFSILQAEIPSESQKREMEQAIEKKGGQNAPTLTRSIRGVEAGDSTPSTTGAGVDAYDFLEALNILDKVEKMNLEKRMALPKWAERKAALVEVEKLCGSPPKLAKGDYSGLVGILRSTVQRDSNQAVVVQVIKLYGVLACGLRDEFSSYAKAIFGTLLAKLKDKKMALLVAVEKTIEALVQHCFSLFEEKVLASLKQAFSTNSTPPQRLKIVSFIATCLLTAKVWVDAAAMPEGFKELLDLACQALEDADAKVRGAAIQLFSSIKDRNEPASVASSLERTLEDISKRIPRAFTKITKGPSTAAVEPKAKAKPKRNVSQRPASKATPKKPRAKPPTKKSHPVAVETPAPATVELMSVDDAANVSQTLPGIPEAIQLFDGAEKWQDKVHLFEAVGKQVDGCTQETAQALIVFLGSRTRQFKDSNFNLMNKTWEAITKLLSIKPNEAYLGSFLPAAVSKLGDKKQKPSVNTLLLGAIEVYGPMCIVSMIIGTLKSGKSGPKVNEEALNFISTCMEEFGGKQMSCAVKNTVEHACGICGLGAKQMPVKIAASKLLVKVYEHCGEKIKKLLSGHELDKMQTAFDKATVLDQSFAPSRSIKGQEAVETAEANILGQRKDFSTSFPPDLFKQLSDTVSKNSWKIRFKAIDDIVKVFESANRYVAHNRAVMEVVSELKKRLSDSNRNLVGKAIRALGVIGQSVGSASASAVIRQAGKALLGCLTDSNKTILSSVYECLTHWCVFDDATVAAPFFQLVSQCEAPLCSVKHDRAGLLKWLLQQFPATAPEDDLVQLVKPALSCLQSRDASTRKMGCKMVSKVVTLLGDTRGKELFQASCRDLKPAVTRSLNPLLQKAYTDAGSSTEQSAPVTSTKETTRGKARAPREREKKTKSRRASSPRAKIRSPINRKLTAQAEDDNGPVFLVVESSLKLKRVEKGRRKKWPTVIEEKDRAELVADLRHDLERVVSVRLVNSMFADAQEGTAPRSFRGAELEPAFKTLLAEVPNSASQVLECLDLILKWTTLHLSSNNSTVTGHVLQLLESLFELCCGADYRLLEPEAAAFIPHLVLKLGDKQKRFRECVQLSNRNVYVVSECVDECSLLVDKHGPSLLKLKPVHSKHTMLRTIAELVGDSRKDVRNAALRFVEAVWELENRDSDRLFKRIAAHKAVVGNKTQTLVQNHLNQALTKSKTPGKGIPSSSRKSLKAPPKSPQASIPQSPVTPPLPRKQVGSSLFNVELPTTPPSPNVQSPFSPDDNAQSGRPDAEGGEVSNGGLVYTPLISLVERIKCAHLDLADFAHTTALNALELVAGDSAPEGCNYSSSEWLHLLAEHLDVNRTARALASELQNGADSSDTKALVSQALLTLSWNNVLAMKLDSETVGLVVHAAFAVLFNSSKAEPAIELKKTVQAVVVKLSAHHGWFSAMLCRLVESVVERERAALVHCIETYIEEQENESDPYTSVDMTEVVEALQRLVVDSQHKGLCEAIVKSMLSAGKRFTEHLAPSSTLRVVVARCLLQSKTKNDAGQGSDENQKKQPQTEAPAVNVASIRERLGRLRKDYLNISANSPGKATLDSIRARMARQKKA